MKKNTLIILLISLIAIIFVAIYFGMPRFHCTIIIPSHSCFSTNGTGRRDC